ncbi:MAG TPA: hypothetical protein VIL36_13935 [Acidimicrobiales bacterium]
MQAAGGEWGAPGRGVPGHDDWDGRDDLGGWSDWGAPGRGVPDDGGNRDGWDGRDDWGDGEAPVGDDPDDEWSDWEWDQMARAAAAAQEEAFRDTAPEPLVRITGPTEAVHLRPEERRFRDAFRDDPAQAVRALLTDRATLAIAGTLVGAIVFVLVALAAFGGSDPSDDVTLNGPRTTDDTARGLTGADETTVSTVGDTTTAPAPSTTAAPSTTTPDDEDDGSGGGRDRGRRSDDDDDDEDEDDEGSGGNGPPTSTPGTTPPPAQTSTTAPTTTTTAPPQPAIDRFDVEVESWCPGRPGAVQARLSWQTQHGTSAALVNETDGQPTLTVNLTEDGYVVCPRPGEQWTLRVTGPSGTRPATRTITIPALGG